MADVFEVSAQVIRIRMEKSDKAQILQTANEWLPGVHEETHQSMEFRLKEKNMLKSHYLVLY